MSESFTFDVNYSTTFKQIERLRSLMLNFVQLERRDFQPSFDVVVVDIPDQEKMTLQADIMYKSNWQQGALKCMFFDVESDLQEMSSLTLAPSHTA